METFQPGNNPFQKTNTDKTNSVDPMCGSGTTCKMALLNGRKFIGIDISQDYCKIARYRINNTLKQLKSLKEYGKESKIQ